MRKIFIAPFIILIAFVNCAQAQLPEISNKKYDVFGIGTATIDIISQISEEDFKRLLSIPYNISKGEMKYVDENTVNTLQARMKNSKVMPGDSAANVMVALASLGGKTAFNTIVADDSLGVMFNKSLEETSVHPVNKPKTDNFKTARNLIFVTPDGERTMLTYSGIAEQFSQVDIKYHKIKDYKLVYIEGGIWDNEGRKSKATRRALNSAKRVGTLKAFALHDSFFVKKYRDQFLDIVQDVDFIFCNEGEGKALFDVKDFESAITEFKKLSAITVMTASEKGAYIINGEQVIHVPSKVVKKDILDTTGAGDGFTAGFLYGYINGKDLRASGELGAEVASFIIEQIGARPRVKLSDVIKL